MGEWVAVLDRDVVELLIVNDQLAGSVLVPNKEHWGHDQAVCICGFDPFGTEHLIQDLTALCSFLLIHVIWAAQLGQWLCRV